MEETKKTVTTTDSVVPERSTQELNELLKTAKVRPVDIFPYSQGLVFDPNYPSSEIRLVQFNDELLTAFKRGDRLVFRGDMNETVVLCTNDATFDVKVAETSNSLYLMPELKFPEECPLPKELASPRRSKKRKGIAARSPSPECNFDRSVEPRKIVNVAHSFLEAKKINPALSRIWNLLKPTVYEGEVDEQNQMNTNTNNPDGELLTLSDILDRIPASEKEIRDYLGFMKTIDINGYVRLISTDYLFRVVSLVLNFVDSNSLDIKAIPISSLQQSLDDLEPRFVFDKVYEWFFGPNAENPDLCFLKEYEICRFYGEILLKSVGRYNFNEFLCAWQESVPEGLNTDLTQLEGFAISDLECSPPVIWYYPEYTMPETVIDRLAVLFKEKPKWKFDEIGPFIQALATKEQSVAVLLTKYTRVSNADGIRYVHLRYAK